MFVLCECVCFGNVSLPNAVVQSSNPGEIQVILHGKLLGMPVAVKLPLANASLSLPDLANEFLDRWDLPRWKILKNPR